MVFRVSLLCDFGFNPEDSQQGSLGYVKNKNMRLGADTTYTTVHALRGDAGMACYVLFRVLCTFVKNISNSPCSFAKFVLTPSRSRAGLLLWNAVHVTYSKVFVPGACSSEALCQVFRAPEPDEWQNISTHTVRSAFSAEAGGGFP